MTDKKKLGEVFKTVGLPPYTYVKPSYYGEVYADILQSGKHLLIEGPSGTGKTCVVFKVFEDLGWKEKQDFSYLSCRDADSEVHITEFFSNTANRTKTNPQVIVIDDFHILPNAYRAKIGSYLKRLSDRAFEHTENHPKVILIGIPTTGVSLLSEALDLGPRLGTYVLSRASDPEIDRLISEGENTLNILLEDREILLAESAGNFWLAQYVCNKVCATQNVLESQDDTKILTFDLLGIRQRLMTELAERYMGTAKTIAKGKKWRPGGNKPYLEILLALCKLPDLVVTFDKLLNVVVERRRPGVKAVRPRIAEVIYNPAKGTDCRKQIAFDPQAGFSIEDPLFRYFLTNLDPKVLFQELGIEDKTVENGRIYEYDIGFSFAGESRQIVEAVNNQMKGEDVVTFYDFDQQAFLLALDLEETLRRVYSQSCRFYLVFLDKNYRDKVWTRFEKDVMTKPGRKGHIIPVVLDDFGTDGTVGISNTIGHVDLRDVWAEVRRIGETSLSIINVVRNRCVLPVLQKLDDTVRT